MKWEIREFILYDVDSATDQSKEEEEKEDELEHYIYTCKKLPGADDLSRKEWPKTLALLQEQCDMEREMEEAEKLAASSNTNQNLQKTESSKEKEQQIITKDDTSHSLPYGETTTSFKEKVERGEEEKRQNKQKEYSSSIGTE